MRHLICAALVFLSACASAKTCPTVAEEAVSVCRAEKACGGVGTGIGMMLGGVGASASGQPNAAEANYNACMERNLSAQKFNASIK